MTQNGFLFHRRMSPQLSRHNRRLEGVGFHLRSVFWPINRLAPLLVDQSCVYECVVLAVYMGHSVTDACEISRVTVARFQMSEDFSTPFT